MALKDDRVEQCLRSCGSDFQTNTGSKARESTKTMTLAFVLLDFQHAGVKLKSVVYETAESRHVAVQKGKQDQNHS